MSGTSARVLSGKDVAEFCRTLDQALSEAVRKHGKMQGGGTSPALVSAVTLMFSIQCWQTIYSDQELPGVVKELTELCIDDQEKLFSRVLEIASTRPLRNA